MSFPLDVLFWKNSSRWYRDALDFFLSWSHFRVHETAIGTDWPLSVPCVVPGRREEGSAFALREWTVVVGGEEVAVASSRLWLSQICHGGCWCLHKVLINPECTLDFLYRCVLFYFFSFFSFLSLHICFPAFVVVVRMSRVPSRHLPLQMQASLGARDSLLAPRVLALLLVRLLCRSFVPSIVRPSSFKRVPCSFPVHSLVISRSDLVVSFY